MMPLTDQRRLRIGQPPFQAIADLDAHSPFVARHDQQRAVILAALTDPPGASQRHAKLLDTAALQIRHGHDHHLLGGGLLVRGEHARQARLGRGVEQLGAVHHPTAQRR